MNEENQKLLPAFTGAGDAELSSQYVALFRRFNPNIPADYGDKKCLSLFRKRVRRTISFSKTLDRPMIIDFAGIQKACMYYVLAKEIPFEARLEVAKAWEEWFDLIIAFTRNRGLITQNLQFYSKLLGDIERLRDGTTETGN